MIPYQHNFPFPTHYNHQCMFCTLTHSHSCTNALYVQHDNPKIQVVLNDGTTVYEHHSDGQRQEKASCLKEFRNRPYPVKLRITYLRGKLEVRDQWFTQKYGGIAPLSLWTPLGNFLIRRGVLVSEIILYFSTCIYVYM